MTNSQWDVFNKGIHIYTFKNKPIKLINMYHKIPATKTSIRKNTSYKGETIEQKIRRIVNNKEPITDGAALIYTERKDGVLPGYDIKTDRWEIAVDAMDKVSKSHLAKREQRLNPKKDENKSDGKPESSQATDAAAS